MMVNRSPTRTRSWRPMVCHSKRLLSGRHSSTLSRMKIIPAPLFIIAILCGISCSPPPLFAQNRIDAGVFLDYLGISQTNTDNFGVGARFAYRIHRNVRLEGEAAYDYGINFNEAYRNITSGDITAIERTSIGVTHG